MSRLIPVTGVNKDIGRTVTRQLAADGFNIGIHYHRGIAGIQETLNAVIANGGNGHLLSSDVANYEQHREVLKHEIVQRGTWYGVVSNAGIARDAAFPTLSNDGWNVVTHTNLDSFHNAIQPCVIPMIDTRQGGRIVTLSSVSDVMSNCGQINYSAAKAGIIGAIKTLVIELAKHKATANCIASGLIGTRMIEMGEGALREAILMIPMKRMGQTEEAARSASYLTPDTAGYVTRQVISINGGML